MCIYTVRKNNFLKIKNKKFPKRGVQLFFSKIKYFLKYFKNNFDMVT